MNKKLKLTVALFGLALSGNNLAYAATCDTADVSFRSQMSADDCGGAYRTSFNNVYLGPSKSGQHNVNEAFNQTTSGSSGISDDPLTLFVDESKTTDNLLFGGSDWLAHAKYDTSPVSSVAANFLGFNWSLTAPNANIGEWTLKVADDADLANNTLFPITVDLLVVLKGGSLEWSAYLFEDQSFSGLGTSDGEFKISFLNNTNNQNNPALSHMDVFFRDGTVDDYIPGLPEPASIALLGIGLLGMAFSRKSKVL